MSSAPPPLLTIITVTPDGYENVRRTIDHLKVQTVRDRIELIVVAPSRDSLAGAHPELADFPHHQIVEVGRPASRPALVLR